MRVRKDLLGENRSLQLTSLYLFEGQFRGFRCHGSQENKKRRWLHLDIFWLSLLIT